MKALSSEGRGLRTFSWRWSRSHSLALTVLHRTHPTKRPFDAPVVVPADAVVDRDEHLVAGTLLPMPGIDGFRPHAPEEPLRGGGVRGTALGARRPCQAVAVHERQPPGHRQWHPRSECTRGCAPSGGVSAALTSILSASFRVGTEPAVYATILPSWQPTGGERHALPVPGPDPG